MSDFEEMCGYYGTTASNPDALDIIMDGVHESNMKGELMGYFMNDGEIDIEEAIEIAHELGYDDLNEAEYYIMQ